MIRMERKLIQPTIEIKLSEQPYLGYSSRDGQSRRAPELEMDGTRRLATGTTTASNVDTIQQAANNAPGTGIQPGWTKPAFIVDIGGFNKQSATVPVSGLENKSATIAPVSYGSRGQRIKSIQSSPTGSLVNKAA